MYKREPLIELAPLAPVTPDAEHVSTRNTEGAVNSQIQNSP